MEKPAKKLIISNSNDNYEEGGCRDSVITSREEAPGRNTRTEIAISPVLANKHIHDGQMEQGKRKKEALMRKLNDTIPEKLPRVPANVSSSTNMFMLENYIYNTKNFTIRLGHSRFI